MRAEHVKIWRNRTKKRIIDAFGGKCGMCEYNKCDGALELHHLDPSKKNFSFGTVRANPKNWADIVIELRKCVLICANCHREIHNNVSEVPDNITRFDEDFSDYKKIELADKTATLVNKCPICFRNKPLWMITCSENCSYKMKGRYDWSKFDLHDLYVNKKTSIQDLSRLVGCSEIAICKRLKKLGLYIFTPKKIVVWPDKSYLEIAVKEKSLERISQEIGCSHTGLRKHLKRNGISWMYPGYWQKRYSGDKKIIEG